MKVGIVGFGFVGKALFSGIKDSVEIIKIDPALNTKISDLIAFNPAFVFICVPTPMQNDGNQDISILEAVFEEIKCSELETNLILKSTVTPDNLEILNEKLKFVYNPEFLREKTADSDFINSELILFGGEKDLCKTASSFYLNFTLCKQKDHFHTDLKTASFVKYTINTFLALKVTFFNQLFELMQPISKEDWGKFIKIVSADKRIGNSHMSVPGHDGRKGFGGACFPKDISALRRYSEKINYDFSLINEVIKINNQIRSVYNEPIDRERDQNISFKKE